MLPKRNETGIAALQLDGRLMCGLGKGLILLGALTCGRINLLELGNRKRRFLGIAPRKAFVKIRELRLTEAKLLDDESHLETPVAEMHIAYHLISEEGAHAFQSLTDDGGAQVADVERLCDIRAAVVDDNLPMFVARRAALLCLRERTHGSRERSRT